MTKTQKIVYYVLNVLLSVLFLFSAYSKLIADPQAIQGFAVAGLPIWFMYTIGALEVLGAIGLWVRKIAPVAAAGLVIIMVAATILTAVFMSVPFAALPLVVGIILVIQIWLGSKRVSAAPASSAAVV